MTSSVPRVAVASAAAAALAAVLAVIQLRTGVVPMLDTVTYWSGIRATADGHPFTTELAPSFSNFGPIEFLERHGRLPFVDFPVGYPIVAGLVAVVVGAEPSMIMFSVLASMVIAVCVVIGPRSPSAPLALGLRVLAVVGLLALPAHRLVTQATLSEPIFTAVVLALAVALGRHRRGEGSWWVIAVLVIASGLLRFIGAPLAALAGLEHFRRHRSALRAGLWTLALALPAAANIMWASAAGGGHSAGWRGLDGDDVEVFVRSVGGWFEADQGDLRLTYFGGMGPAWWAWPLTVLWLGGLLVAGVGVLSDVFRRVPSERRARWRLPDAIEIPWTMALIITSGLVLGMLGFDALVIPDNRLMLPAGILTLVGLVWWSTEALESLSSTRRPRAGVALLVVIGIWIVVAARPTRIDEIFSDPAPARGDITAVLESSPAVVIANDADGVHWATAVPSAYAPLPTKALTGEPVDVAAVYASLPCPLAEAGGVVVLADDALFGSNGRDQLDELVAADRLVAEPFDGGVLYRPGPSACS